MPKVSALLAFIVILLAACSPSGSPQATQTPAPAVTLVPTETPTPRLQLAAQQNATPFAFPPRAAPVSICDGAPPTYLIVHERARVTNDDPQPLNVRETAGLDGDRVGQLDMLDIFMVIDGPRCADSYTWFKIRAGGVEGWVAEGDDEQYYIEPYLP